MSQRVVVIGNGMAGARVVEELRLRAGADVLGAPESLELTPRMGSALAGLAGEELLVLTPHLVADEVRIIEPHGLDPLRMRAQVLRPAHIALLDHQRGKQ